MREPDLRLLCERCGYHLKGLSRADNCPECGKPVVESLPQNRVGSPWQQGPGWRSWWGTGTSLFRHPMRFWDGVIVRPRWSAPLLFLNCFLAGFGPMAPFILVSASAEPREMREALLFCLVGVGASAVLLLLTGIESIGVGLISRRRGLRIHRGRRLVILSHATYGWVALAITTPLGFIAAFVVAQYSSMLANVVAFSGLLAGLLAFESLVYIGVRRMRFANPPGSERELVDEGSDRG